MDDVDRKSVTNLRAAFNKLNMSHDNSNKNDKNNSDTINSMYSSFNDEQEEEEEEQIHINNNESDNESIQTSESMQLNDLDVRQSQMYQDFLKMQNQNTSN